METMQWHWLRGVGWLWRRHIGMAVIALLAIAQVGLAASPSVQEELLAAINAGDLGAVQSAVKRGADLNVAGAFQRTPLHDAVKTVNSRLIEWMLGQGANPSSRDGDGRSPLHLANSVSAQALLRHKADVHLVDRQGSTALHTAAESDRELCRLLAQAGVPVNVRNLAGLTPLHFAVLRGKRPPVATLLDLGADVNAKTTAEYLYKWSYIAWDVQGMEVKVASGMTPVSLARQLHKQNRWSSGAAYDDLANFLLSRGAVERKWWPLWE